MSLTSILLSPQLIEPPFHINRQSGTVKQDVSPSAVRTAQSRGKDASLLVASSNANSNLHHEVEERLRHSFQLSKPSHSIQGSLPVVACPHHLQDDQKYPPFLCSSTPTCSYCIQREALHQRPTVSQSPTPAPPTHNNCTRHGCGNCVCIVDSFNTLSMSSPPAQGHMVSTVPQSMALLRSCREEAAAVANRNYLDDTTVDDLAGYLDEIMFIPKPMSAMAELMYT